MEGYAFQSQMFFLVQKFRIHQEMAADKGESVLVQDRTIFEDAEIFCTNLYRSKKMARRDYETYMAMYRTILNAIPRPKVLIYLHCSVRTLMQRIARRGRASEMAVPADYIKQLDKLYKKWVSSYTMSPLVTIETEKIDYLEDFIEQDCIMHQLSRHLC
jgi:deoxyadenosine/deoxycytidine kinase